MSIVINNDSLLNKVKTSLLTYIEKNKLKHDEQLPSETALAKMLGVSRNTLREAYIALENDGVIYRRHGIGTFVTRSPVISDKLNYFLPFAQMIKESGYTPNFQTLSMGYECSQDDVYDAFSIPHSTKVFCVRRIVRADKQPVIYIEDHLLPIDEVKGINWSDFDGNMIQFLSTSLNTPMHHIQSHIRAEALNAEYSQYLELDSETPILNVKSYTYVEANDKPIVFSKIIFNSNIIELNVLRMIHK